MPKKSLASQITDIAKKNKISLKKDAVVRGAVDIRGPLSRPCGSGETAQNRYRLSDLQDLARASGVDSKQDMDTLCRVLGIKPHVDRVQVPVKSCNSKARGSDRYTRDDVVALARSRGMTVSGKTMDELCDALGIESSQVVRPSSLMNAKAREEEEMARRLGSYSPPSRRAVDSIDFDRALAPLKKVGPVKSPVPYIPQPPVYTSLPRSSSSASGPIQLVNSSSSVFGMSRALGPGPNENAVTGQNPYNSQSPTSLSEYEEDFNFQPDISSSSSSSMVPLGQLRRSKRISVKNKVE